MGLSNNWLENILCLAECFYCLSTSADKIKSQGLQHKNWDFKVGVEKSCGTILLRMWLKKENWIKATDGETETTEPKLALRMVLNENDLEANLANTI